MEAQYIRHIDLIDCVARSKIWIRYNALGTCVLILHPSIRKSRKNHGNATADNLVREFPKEY